MASPVVVLYDPNGVNPYGLETARIIAEVGRRPILLRPSDSPRSAPPGVQVEPVLQPGGSGLLRRSWFRLTGPLRALAIARRSPLVVVWTKGLWDALVMTCRARLIGSTWFVLHNPPQIRRRTGAGGIGERLLARSAVVCVHSEAMAQTLGADARVRVISHPSYRWTARRAPTPAARPMRVALVGSLRQDKGVADLRSIAEASGGGWDLVVAGPDRLPDEVCADLVSAGVQVTNSSGGTTMDEDQLNALVSSATVVLAPYRSVTESGSVLLAQTLGVAVLGYDCPSFRDKLTPGSIADGPAELGLLLRDFLTDPWPTFTRPLDDIDSHCENSWRSALEEDTHDA